MDHWQHISITNHRCCCCCWSIWVRLLPKTSFMKCHWTKWTEKKTLLMPYTYCPKPYIKLAISFHVTAFVSLPHSQCLFRICKNNFFSVDCDRVRFYERVCKVTDREPHSRNEWTFKATNRKQRMNEQKKWNKFANSQKWRAANSKNATTTQLCNRFGCGSARDMHKNI